MKLVHLNEKDYDIEQFEQDLHSLKITLSENQIKQLIRYYELLVEWNKKMNLTAITEYNDVLKKHFIDSLSLVQAIDLNQEKSIIDIGTGAGFPGMVLKIVFPNIKITLLDSLNKRIHFLNQVIDELQLNDIEAIHGRAEDFSKPQLLREKYDLCVSRAVANLSTLSEYCLPFVKVGGQFIPYKSEKSEEEIQAALYAINILGGKYIKSIDFHLPQSDLFRSLIVIKKDKITPNKYPRKAGLPAKDPIFKSNTTKNK